MPQEVVYLVRKNQLFKFDIALAQFANQINGLIERDVAVVVAMNQQHRRFPFFDRRYGRRFAPQFDQLARRPRRGLDPTAPVETAMHLNSRRNPIAVKKPP